MSVSVVITNLTASAITISEMYTTLGAAGTPTASVTIARSVAQLDSMPELKALVNANTVSCVPTQSADNVDLISIPLEQHGIAAGVSVNAAAEVTTPVVFVEAFPAGVVPKLSLMVDKTDGPASRSMAYAENITNAGFDIQLVVTTADTGLTVDVHWLAVY